MLSVRPKVNELNFHLYARNVHPELFDVCARRTIERENYEVSLNITTDGHMITYRHGPLVLTEIGAAANHPLPAKRLLMSRSVEGQTTEDLLYEEVISYRTSFSMEVVPLKTFATIHQQLNEKFECEGLVHRFGTNGRVAFGAVSYINVQAFRSHIILRSFHTFPDTQAVMRSESSFTIGNA